MAGPQFHQTRLGKRFIQNTMPRLAEATEDLAENVEKQNELLETILEEIQ